MFVFADCSERLDFMCWHSITEASATHRKLSSGLTQYMSINNKKKEMVNHVPVTMVTSYYH